MTQIDRSEQASEIIYTRAVMSAAAKTLGLMNDNTRRSSKIRFCGVCAAVCALIKSATTIIFKSLIRAVTRIRYLKPSTP